MASLWQKKTGMWCVTYRENGKQRARSLRTKDKREALKLKRAIETMLEERGAVALHASDQPQPEKKNPTLDEFWSEFLPWAAGHRSQSTVEKALKEKNNVIEIILSLIIVSVFLCRSWLCQILTLYRKRTFSYSGG